jgi:uncharacterized protein (DUF1330 family)
MKKAYLIGHIKIKNLTKWEEYKSKLPNNLEEIFKKLVLALIQKMKLLL